MKWDELTPMQVELLAGLLGSFEAMLGEDEVWTVYHGDNEEIGLGETLVEAMLDLADKLSKEVNG
jgi:hypothetical protein